MCLIGREETLLEGESYDPRGSARGERRVESGVPLSQRKKGRAPVKEKKPMASEASFTNGERGRKSAKILLLGKKEVMRKKGRCLVRQGVNTEKANVRQEREPSVLSG